MNIVYEAMEMTNMGIGSYVRSRKAVKASRAALEGIAGHQAAMAALTPDKKPEKGLYGTAHSFYNQEEDK
jgi:hypothetical protein